MRLFRQIQQEWDSSRPLGKANVQKLPPLTPEDDELDLPASEVSLPKINIEPTSPAPNIKGTFLTMKTRMISNLPLKKLSFTL